MGKKKLRSSEQKPEQEHAGFGPRVMTTGQFTRSWQALSPQMRQLAHHKIRLLAQDRQHPSLRAHRLHRFAGLWECAVSRTHRIVYRVCEGRIWLCDIGKHQVIDRCHLRDFRAASLETKAQPPYPVSTCEQAASSDAQ